jgi:adenylate cyclase
MMKKLGRKLRLTRGEATKVALVVVALAAVEIANALGAFVPSDLVFHDLWHRLAGKRYEPTHAVLVVIDEPTLNDYRKDPLVFWTPHIARASRTARQAGAAMVGLDFLFSISPETWLGKNGLFQPSNAPSYDHSFRVEIGSGQLIQVCTRTRSPEGYDDFLLPSADYLMSMPDLDLRSHLSLAGLDSDGDSAVRSFTMTPVLRLAPGVDSTSLPRFSLGPLLALRAAKANLDDPGWLLAGQEVKAGGEPLAISFAGPPGTIQRISMRDLLAPDALQRPQVKALRDKIVIIGGEYIGMGDLHPTPYASSLFGGMPALMSGSEIQANIVETLMSGRRLSALPAALNHAYIITLPLFGIFVFWILRPVWGLAAATGMIAVSLLLSYQAFLHWILLPTAVIPLALATAYLGCLGVKLGTEARERKRITSIFSRYVSDNVMEVLIDADNAPEMGGVKQQITILFSDIRDFTTISEKLDAHEVVEFLNHYFEQICEVVLAEGGTIDKFIGDAIMVQFGAPVRFPDHALRAIRAALMMRDKATAFRGWMSDRFPNRGLPEFRIGIGVHTGDAVVGNIGSTRRSEYTAIGDSVNLASRIEGMTKAMGCDILISRETLEAVNGRAATGLSDSVNVKGRTAPVELFELLGLIGDKT